MLLFLQTALPVVTPSGPLTVAAWVAGILLSAPVLVVLIKAVFFFASATTKLNAVVDGLALLVSEMKDFRHDKNEELQSFEVSLVIIENDVNALQAKAGLPVRPYPDRRSGKERRQA